MDKVAVLIAAGSGMGANAAKKLSKDGFKIAVMSSSDKAIKLSNSLKSFMDLLFLFFLCVLEIYIIIIKYN